MKRRFEGLHQANQASDIPDGVFLVRVSGARYQWHAHKPYYSLRLRILEPTLYGGLSISSRVFCTPKTLWKLNWFLRDFGYDVELLGHDEVGVVKVSRVVVNDTSLLNLDGFATAASWQELSPAAGTSSRDSEVA